MAQPTTDTWSIFDVIGPVMVGPSSSHTAGACTLGYMAGLLFGHGLQSATLHLHGSFGEVYEGHCTDVAIIGGLLGLLPHDGRIATAYDLAEAAGISITLKPCHLGAEYHPNTVKFDLQGNDKRMVIVGSSLGGGKIAITEIDKIPVRLTGAYSSLVICFDEGQHSLMDFLKFAMEEGLDPVKTETYSYKNRIILDIEIRQWFESAIIEQITSRFDVKWVRYLNHISHYDQS